MKNIFLTVVLVIISFFKVYSQEDKKISKNLVDVQRFEVLINEHPGQIVDVRTPDEFKAGSILGAININYFDENFKQEMKKLDQSKPIYIFCQSGRRSAEAHKVLKEEGFTTIVELEGGYKAWKVKN